MAACVLLASIVIARWCFWPDSTVVTNNSGSLVTDVTLSLTSIDGRWKKSRSAKSLEPGESMIIRHAQNDTSVLLKYVMDGATMIHIESYVDLWWGEQWSLCIEEHGSIDSGY